MPTFRVKRFPRWDKENKEEVADVTTVENVERMEVFRSGELGFVTKQGRLVRAIADGEWDEAWELTEPEQTA